MADLPESSSFDDAITQIETNEPVVGGPNGVSNRALKQLANRSRWLYDQVQAVLASLADDYALRDGDYGQLRARATTKGDVGLGSVPNYGAVNDASGGQTDRLLTAAGGKLYTDQKTGPLAAKTGDYGQLRARATTKGDVGLGNVANYGAVNDAAGGQTDRYATARAVRDAVDGLDFSNTKAGNGYQRLPSGLILQWGRTVTNGGDKTILYPVAFPNTVAAAQATSALSDYTNLARTVAVHVPVGQEDTHLRFKTVSNNDEPVSGSVHWFAIGY